MKKAIRYIELKTGDEYWISGVKKKGQNRHWAGNGKILIDHSIVAEYLIITIQPTSLRVFSSLLIASYSFSAIKVPLHIIKMLFYMLGGIPLELCLQINFSKVPVSYIPIFLFREI